MLGESMSCIPEEAETTFVEGVDLRMIEDSKDIWLFDELAKSTVQTKPGAFEQSTHCKQTLHSLAPTLKVLPILFLLRQPKPFSLLNLRPRCKKSYNI
jgi:hypothetical protein